MEIQQLHKKANRKKRLILVVLACIGLVAIASGIYFLFVKEHQPAEKTQLHVTDTSKRTQRAESHDLTTQTKHYVSSNLTLEFDYPQDWTITDTAGSGQLIAKSPVVHLKNASNKSIDGRVLLTIRSKQQALQEFDKGNAIAARESQKITYTKPSSVQRGSTYISFLRYASNVPGSLSGIYISGNVGYKQAQAIPKADFTPVDPVINLTFEQCSASACSATQASATAIAPAMWDETSFNKPLTTLLQSFTLN